MTLEDLAARVEALEGPDRGIAQAIVHLLYDGDKDMIRSARRGSFDPTASLDVAMSLVPRGWQWMVKDFASAAPAVAKLGVGMVIVNAATPALALTAACLRARALSRTTENGEGA